MDHLPDGFGRMLEVAVHGDHRIEVSADMVEPGGERHLVAPVPRQREHRDARVDVSEPVEQCQRLVSAAIVYEHEGTTDIQGFDGATQTVIERLHPGGLVVERNHDSQRLQASQGYP